MTSRDSETWPTLLFRAAHPTEVVPLRLLLDVPETDDLRFYVLTEAGRSPPAAPQAAVALEIRDSTWLLRSAFGLGDARLAARLGSELLAEAVRAGASTVATPVEASPACRAVLADGRGVNRGGWLVAEL